MTEVKEQCMCELGNSITCRTSKIISGRCESRRFQSLFGVTSSLATLIWLTLVDDCSVPVNGKPVHLLWTLAFFNTYAAESVLSALFDSHEQTVRTWVWEFASALATMDLVSHTCCLRRNCSIDVGTN
jgi:hypothetical protein